MKIRNIFQTILFTILFGSVSSLALGEVTGPTVLSANFGSTEVLAWSWGASQSGTMHTGGGGGAGKANFQDISLSRLSDSLSAEFLKMVANGYHMPEVTLTRGTMNIVLQNVIVTSYSISGISDRKDPTVENISLNFAGVKFEVDGNSFCWDIAANVSVVCN